MMNPQQRALGAGLVILLLMLPGCSKESGPAAAVEAASKLSLDHLSEPAREQLEERAHLLEEAVREPHGEDLAQLLGDSAELYQSYGFLVVAEDLYRNALLLSEKFRWHYLLGILRQERGELEAAASSYRHALELEPANRVTLLRLGEVLLLLGDSEQASDLFERARQIDSADAAAQFGLGRAALAREDHQEAVERFVETLGLEPGATRVHYFLALAYRGLGRTDEARLHLLKQGEVEVEIVDPILAELESQAIGPALYLRQAEDALRVGRRSEAEALLRRATEADPEGVEARRALGEFLVGSGELEEASALYEEGLRLDPGAFELHRDLSSVLLSRGLIEKAVAHLQQAVSVAPGDIRARLDLARSLERVGRPQDAMVQYDAVLNIDSEQEMARVGRSMSLLRDGRRKQGLAELEAAIDRRPTSSFLHINLANVLFDLGETGEALEHYRKTTEISSDTLERCHARLKISQILLRRNETGAAVAELEAALREDPAHVPSLFLLAELRIAEERYPEARDHLVAALSAAPANAEVAHALARLLVVSADPSVRDSERALVLSRQLSQQSSRPEFAETLAMALAGTGSFDQAVALQRRLIAESQERDDLRSVGRLRANLSHYERHEPCCGLDPEGG